MSNLASFSRRREPHCVYRAYDANGVLLYIGCAIDPDRRQRQHISKPWYGRAVRWTREWHPDFLSARKAEREAIATELHVGGAA